MFYADFVLSKKGPLSKVWLAAHWEKKLSKAQIFETDVDEAVNEIMRPSQKLALRTTGHLLLGICRVYSRKTKYLLADTNEAFLKIKLAFRNGGLDAPNPVMPTFSIQDIYGEFGDNILPEFDDEELNHAPICQSRLDDITLKEDIPQRFDYNIGGDLGDDDFGEIAAGVGPEDYQRMMDDCNRMDMEMEMARNASKTSDNLFGREREPTPLLNDAHAPGNAIFGEEEFAGGDDDHMDDDDHNVQSSSGYNNSHMEEMDYDNSSAMARSETPLRSETPMTFRAPSPSASVANSATPMEQDTVDSYYERQIQKRALQREQNMRKRRVDEVKMITGDDMKANMADFSDTLTRLDLAAPSRKLMIMKKRSTPEFLLHFPAMINFTKNKQYIRKYQSHLTVIKHADIEEKNEYIRNAMGLRDIGDDEMQIQQQEMDMHVQEDPTYSDDFDEVAPLDIDNIDMMVDIPQQMDESAIPDDDTPQPNPLSPFATIQDDEDMSPSEKRKRREEDKEEPEGDEDNRWSKRTHALLQTIATKINNTTEGEIELEELLKKNTSRKIAAAKFYSLLCLKKNQCVDVHQNDPYGDIKIKAGPNINISML